ncbi:MAG: low molecular weight phosphatase family protein [Caldiserica bacterium CG_4_8_14_3_um_filter_35_18]|nr:arsenate reductase ArsC [Caldisericota bacterium]PIX29270.1 MAG: low molecular weight phosphatase family protein [Caldiserica bacterium CG_4_8_14_3_um_filter_35_18]
MKKRILFICTHNSARSQMAEAFLKTLFPERFEVYSAGTQPGKLNPFVVKAMVEVGMDISGNHTKSVDEFKGDKFDLVVTVCDQAKETCPYFPGALDYLHRNFEDPSTFTGSEEEIMEKVRQVRDNIKNWVIETFGEYK